MSFWAGVVQATKDIEVRNQQEALADERERIQKYNEARDRKADERYNSQLELADARYTTGLEREDAAIVRAQDSAAQARQDRLDAAASAAAAAAAANAESKRRWTEEQSLRVANGELSQATFDQGVSEFERTQERLDAAAALAESIREEDNAEDLRRFELDEDRKDRIEERDASNTALERTVELLKLSKTATQAFSGLGGDVNDGDVIPVNGMEAAVMNIKSELETAGGLDNLNDTDQEWFKTVIDNPAAAAGILAFVQAQRKDGNDLPITELPRIIQLAGTMEAAGAEALADFKERFAAGNVDMNDPDQYLAGLKALTEFEPAKLVWGQVKPVTDTQTQNALFESWQLDTVMGARVALMNMEPGPEKTALAETINNASSTDKDNALNRQEAFISLWGEYGEASAEGLGLTAENNKRMRQYFNIRGKSPIAEAAQNPTAPEAPMTPDTSGMGAPESTTSSMPGERGVTPLDSSPAINFGTQEEADAWYNTVGPEELSKIPSITISGKVYANTEYTGVGGVESRAPSMPAEAGRTLNPQDEPAEGLGSLVPEQRDTSPLSRIVYDFEEDKGAPLSPDEEIAVGIEAVVKSLSGVGIGPDELEDLIIELKGKFGEQRVQEALMLAMNQE